MRGPSWSDFSPHRNPKCIRGLIRLDLRWDQSVGILLESWLPSSKGISYGRPTGCPVVRKASMAASQSGGLAGWTLRAAQGSSSDPRLPRGSGWMSEWRTRRDSPVAKDGSDGVEGRGSCSRWPSARRGTDSPPGPPVVPLLQHSETGGLMAEQGKCKSAACKCRETKVNGFCSDSCSQGKTSGGKCACTHPDCK
jgi:hypothetical protein